MKALTKQWLNSFKKIFFSGFSLLWLVAVLVVLYIAYSYNFLLFHTLIEMATVCIAFAVFVIVWNSRKYLRNNYILFLGIAYLFVAGIDLLHTLTYEGMNIFEGYGTNLATQLWIGGRYMESASLLLAPLFIKRKFNHRIMFAGFGAVTILFLLSIFQWDIFPVCFDPETGLTTFKRLSEFAIIGILVAALVPLLGEQRDLAPSIPRWIGLSIVFTIGSELFFVMYESPFDAANAAGHFFKLISFYFIYKALIETGLQDPQSVTFGHFKQREQQLWQDRTELQSKLYRRDKELRNAIMELAEQTHSRLDAEEELAESEMKYRTLVENIPGIAYIESADKPGQILYVSPQVKEILGYSIEEFKIELEFRGQLIHPDDRDRVKKQFNDSRRKQKTFVCEYRIVAKDGKTVWLRDEDVVVRNQAGKLLFYQGTMYNITIQKAAQAALDQHRYELEKRVNERTSELEQSNKDLESFAYSVSHDLRSPLRAIEGFSRILLEEHSDQLDDEAGRLLNIICKNTERMNQLIDGILNLSRHGRRQIKHLPIDMEKLARQVANEVCAIHNEKKYDIKINPLPKAVGDPSMVREVLVNLISNAAKFSNGQKNPKIEVGAEGKNGQNVYFVKDNGIGFDMQYYDKLFGVFNRLHSNKDFQGSGIGLANVQKIIQRHKGQVWAESKLNQGSAFYFTLVPEND